MVYKVDNKAIWMEVSQKLYSLMKPNGGSTTHLFGVETDSTGQHYININLNLFCPIHLKATSSATMKQIGDLLGLSTEERATIKAYILANNPIQLVNILPSFLEEYTPIYNAP